jgi:hypothetical protein
MKLISHRGNIDGLNPDRENSPEYILEALSLGYDVEVDVRENNDELYLGHDYCQYKINIDWIKKYEPNLWIHAKDINSVNLLIGQKLKMFFHEKESHTIIHNTNLIWSHNINEATKNSIIPLLDLDTLNKFKDLPVYGICSDFVKLIK